MTSTSTDHSYEEAVSLLDSLQSNRTIVSSISSSSQDMNALAIPEMLEWTRKAGYEVEDFAKRGLKCIHVAGTKGKGSTCVMVENLLRQYRRDSVQDVDGAAAQGARREGLGKIGLYTSPHLLTVRERIRIDGSPISEALFTHYFFEIWDRLSHAASTANPQHPDPTSSSSKPGYFRYLTIMALHTFMEERVESAIIECGIGGEYDSTNILPPAAVTVTAITRLGIDHIGMLGDTVDKIAWHKAGIMKNGIPAFTIPQSPEAQVILEQRAQEKDVNLQVVTNLPGLGKREIQLGMEGEFQYENASLAVAVAASHLRQLGITNGISTVSDSTLPEQFLTGLRTTKWPGRCEVRLEGNTEWYIDGAHTIDSIEAAALWYTSCVRKARDSNNPPTATMLIFNQQDQARDTRLLLQKLLSITRERLGTKFTYAAFCTNVPFKEEKGEGEEGQGLEVQEKAAKLYKKMDANQLYMVYGSIEEAVALARKVSEGDEKVMVFVTGSLYLVGGLMKVLDKQAEERNGLTK